jgi:transposase-like protein
VSTRKVESIVGELGIELSHESVSRLSSELDELISDFKTSALEEHYGYIYVDSLYLKVYDGARFVSKAVMIAIGVSAQTGIREILDIDIVHEESYASYHGFFESLKERGIKKVDLVISDGHKGIKKAAKESFTGSSWQLCTVHLKRNIMKIVPKKYFQTVLKDINEILYSESFKQALPLINSLIASYEDKNPKLAEFFMNNLYDACTYLSFPKTHHRKIHSTNVLERFNKEVKRRTKVIGAFPNDGSILRLLVPLAIDTNAKWLTRSYVKWENVKHNKMAEDDFTELS